MRGWHRFRKRLTLSKKRRSDVRLSTPITLCEERRLSWFGEEVAVVGPVPFRQGRARVVDAPSITTAGMENEAGVHAQRSPPASQSSSERLDDFVSPRSDVSLDDASLGQAVEPASRAARMRHAQCEALATAFLRQQQYGGPLFEDAPTPD